MDFINMLIDNCWDTPGTGWFSLKRQSRLHLNETSVPFAPQDIRF